MKRLLVVFLSLLLLCGCAPAPEATSPTANDAPVEEVITFDPLCNGKTLKVLAIGNSFSNNATEYLYEIAQAEGMTEIVIGRLYIGSCTLEKHAACATNNTPDYTYYKNTTGTWEKTEDATMLQGLQDEAWDIITLQQSSGKSGLEGSYDGYLETLIDYVNTNKTNPEAKLVWHQTWAYQGDSTHKDFANYGNDQLSMYYSIMTSCNEKILTNEAFSAVFPVGTAVQNARTSPWGDNITADGYHLNDLGKALGAYTWYAMFTGKGLTQIHLDKLSSGMNLSDQTKSIIIESVNNALQTPTEVTPSAIKK